MPKPELIQRQRETIRSFRQIDSARRDAELAAEQQQAQTTASAETTHQTARQNAENARKQSLTAGETQRQNAHRNADSTLKSIRSRAQEQTNAAASVANIGWHTVNNAGLVHLWPSGPTKSAPAASVQAETELARRVQLAGQAGKQLENAMDAEKDTQARATRRRRTIRNVALAGILVFLFAFWRFQARQSELSVQATATAIVQATATAAPLATATAVAQAQATATVVAGLPFPDRIKAITGIEFVEVPAGDFTMGSPDGEGEDNEHPQHTVFLDDFWVGKTEVTNTQYARCIDAGVCPAPNNEFWNDSVFAEHPVTHVSWNDAVAYTRWLTEQSGVSVRLPSGAEWEKAARGTDGRTYPWGNTDPNDRLLSYSRTTTPVGSYPDGASPYGALDMTGNAWEWVTDWYAASYDGQSSARNPTGPKSGQYRVMRGGSYYDDHDGVRCASRYGASPDSRSGGLGFRLLSPGN